MRKHLAALITLGLVSSLSVAAPLGEQQAEAFAGLFAENCLKHLANLDALRVKLKSTPKLPPAQAAHFLPSHSGGEAWPIADDSGLFVLAIPTGSNVCMVHGKKADAAAVERLFEKFAGSAPFPVKARQVKNERIQTAASGPIHTVAYEWSAPGAPLKMLYTLTTAKAENAPLQVLGIAALTK